MTDPACQIAADDMRAFGTRLLAAAGMTEALAATVSDHVIEANLAGVDSHGLVRFPYYLGLIETGTIDPKAQPFISADTASICQIDGGGNLGIAAMSLAVRQVADKASNTGIAAASVTNVMHTGRIGAYAATLAEAGCFAFITGGGGHEAYRNVAPFGAREGGFSTNPLAMALPDGAGNSVVVDFATSATAQGRLMLARASGEPVPQGQIIDKHGQPSTDPEDFYAGGAILPAAGPKGSGLALIAELLGHALLGPVREFNWLIVAIALEQFAPRSEYDARASHYLDWLKSLKPAAGFERVRTPGEPERLMRQERLKTGLPVPESVREQLCEHARSLGVEPPAALQGRR